MNFIEGGVELKYHTDEITIQGGDGTRLKVINRHGRLLIFNDEPDHEGYSLIVATPKGFYVPDRKSEPMTHIDTVTTLPYQA